MFVHAFVTSCITYLQVAREVWYIHTVCLNNDERKIEAHTVNSSRFPSLLIDSIF